MTSDTHECLSLALSSHPFHVQHQGENQTKEQKNQRSEGIEIIQVQISLRDGD
jgi:hypothetical protein